MPSLGSNPIISLYKGVNYDQSFNANGYSDTWSNEGDDIYIDKYKWVYLTFRRTRQRIIQYYQNGQLLKNYTLDKKTDQNVDQLYISVNGPYSNLEAQISSLAIYARGDDDRILKNFMREQSNPYKYKPPLPYVNKFQKKDFKLYKNTMHYWFGIPDFRTIKHIFPLDGKLWDERSNNTFINNGTNFTSTSRSDIRQNSLHMNNNYIYMQDTQFENNYNQSTISFWIKIESINVGVDQTFMSFYDKTGQLLYSITNKYGFYDDNCQFHQNQYRISKKVWYHLTLFKNHEFVPQYGQNKVTLKTFYQDIEEDDISHYTKLSVAENDYLSHQMYEMRVGCSGTTGSVCDFYIQDIIINAKISISMPHYLFYQDFRAMKYSNLEVELEEINWQSHGESPKKFNENLFDYFPFQYNLKNYVSGQYAYSYEAKFVEDSRDRERRPGSLQLEKFEEVIIKDISIGKDKKWTISFWAYISNPEQSIFQFERFDGQPQFYLGVKNADTDSFNAEYFDDPNNLNKWTHIVFCFYNPFTVYRYALAMVINGGAGQQGATYQVNQAKTLTFTTRNLRIKGNSDTSYIKIQDLAIHRDYSPDRNLYQYTQDSSLFKSTKITHKYRQQQWKQFQYFKNMIYFFPFQNHQKDLITDDVEFNNLDNKFYRDLQGVKLNYYKIQMENNTLDCPKLNGLTSWTISFWINYKEIMPNQTIMNLQHDDSSVLELNQNYIKLFGFTISYDQGVQFEGKLTNKLLTNQTESQWIHIAFSKDPVFLYIFKDGQKKWMYDYYNGSLEFFSYNKLNMHHTSLPNSSIYIQELIIYNTHSNNGEIIQRYLRQNYLFTYYDPLTYETDSSMGINSSFNLKSFSTNKYDYSYIYDYSDQQIAQLLKNQKNKKQQKNAKIGIYEQDFQNDGRQNNEYQENSILDEMYLDYYIGERDFKQWLKKLENQNKTRQDYDEFYSKEENYRLLFQKYQIDDDSEEQKDGDKYKQNSSENLVKQQQKNNQNTP